MTIADGGGPDGARYAEAIALLADLHGRELPADLPVDEGAYVLPVYDIEAMLVEVELALDWYAPAIARVTPPSGARMQFLAIWRDALAPILAQPTTWTLRDFHSPNLHWLADRQGLKRIGLIDFQDAVHRAARLRSRLAPAGRAGRRSGRSRNAAGRPLHARRPPPTRF